MTQAPSSLVSRPRLVSNGGVSGQDLLFDARRVTTIDFSEGRAAKFEQPTTVGGVSL
jgi:hypothetical protein